MQAADNAQVGWNLTGTGFRGAERWQYSNLAGKLGCTWQRNLDEFTTCVVYKSEADLQTSAKAAAAFRIGLPVVSCNWIMASAATARLLDFQPFVHIPPLSRQSGLPSPASPAHVCRDIAKALGTGPCTEHAAAGDNITQKLTATPDGRWTSDISFANVTTLHISAKGMPAQLLVSASNNEGLQENSVVQDDALADLPADTTVKTGNKHPIGKQAGAGFTTLRHIIPLRDISNSIHPLRSNVDQYVTLRRQRRCRPSTSSDGENCCRLEAKDTRTPEPQSCLPSQLMGQGRLQLELATLERLPPLHQSTPGSALEYSTPGSVTSSSWRATPCSEQSTRPASASVWGTYDTAQHGSSAAAHHGVQSSNMQFYRFLEVEAPGLNGEREVYCFDVEEPSQGAMLYYDDVEGSSPEDGSRLLMFARLLFIYKLRTDPDTVWIEHKYLYDEEDILQDRRGFGAGYLRRNILRSRQELVGTPYKYHSCATSIDGTFCLESAADCHSPSQDHSYSASDTLPFFCCRAWDPFTGRSV